jgi:hypothetical protein
MVSKVTRLSKLRFVNGLAMTREKWAGDAGDADDGIQLYMGLGEGSAW